jgi:hypothetical protein
MILKLVDRLDMLANQCPSMIFNNVTLLMVFDCTSFKHEFFVRIVRFFPSLKYLRIFNSKSNAHRSKLGNNQSYPIVEYPHLTVLDIRMSHICYIKQFLYESKTRLSRFRKIFSYSYNNKEFVKN